MYGVIRKIRQFNLPVKIQLELFDNFFFPVLLYGCEVLGYENLQSIERIHLKLLKHIFLLKSSTQSCVGNGETGRYLLFIVGYLPEWSRIGPNSSRLNKTKL